jgi:hypothetical protein
MDIFSNSGGWWAAGGRERRWRSAALEFGVRVWGFRIRGLRNLPWPPNLEGGSGAAAGPRGGGGVWSRRWARAVVEASGLRVRG